ncbi:MAG: hypothetical protein K1X51_18365, partial [Rhodospirillaceae bacterium]|nr:hypothetical protein [Rhodospirillaceae bacterium]
KRSALKDIKRALRKRPVQAPAFFYALGHRSRGPQDRENPGIFVFRPLKQKRKTPGPSGQG